MLFVFSMGGSMGSISEEERKGDMVDRADGDHQAHVAVRVAVAKRSLLAAGGSAAQALNLALDGRAVCRDCDECISPLRLRAIPGALRCVDCQATYELEEARARKENVK